MPGAQKGASILRSLSPTEALLFGFFGLILIISMIGIVWQINESLIEEVPIAGGSLTEGISTVPRFINPLLAFSNADRDLSLLIYAGLLKKNSQGEIIPELAKDYQVSEEGTLYTFTLKDNLYFHDGIPVTADDVVFTVERVQDDRLQSPKRANWTGIQVEKVDDKTVTFLLEEPFAPFLETLTLGILPRHIWENVDVEQIPFSQRNIEPIGAGPYQIDNIIRRDGGTPSSYILSSFENYALGRPYISRITFRIYENEQELVDAYKNGEIESLSGISTQIAKDLSDDNVRIETPALSRVFGIFFNQNDAPVFTDSAFRQALEASIDKEALIKEIFSGFATAADNPFPQYFMTPQSRTNDAEESDSDDEAEEDEEEDSEEVLGEDLPSAEEILDDGGWDFDVDKNLWTKGSGDDIKESSFTLTTGNLPELVEIARFISREWEKIGIKTELIFLDPETLREAAVRPREYEALLFGQVIDRPVDLYAFWHSSQRNDPGLNLALYANVDADRALSALRTEINPVEVGRLIEEFSEEIRDDRPAIFLYLPDLIYVLPAKVKGVELSYLRETSLRFSEVENWFIETNRQWSFFRQNR
jgi:peptide/nickel transport system substrate-binding protein